MTAPMRVIDGLMREHERETGLDMIDFLYMQETPGFGAAREAYEHRGYFHLLRAFNYLRDEWMIEFRLSERQEAA